MKTLALSTKVSAGVKPPATKREVIQAMAEVKHAQLLAERTELKTRMETQCKIAKDELALHCVSQIEKHDIRPDLGYYSGKEIYNVDVRVDFIFANLPKSLQKSITKYHELHTEYRNGGVPDLKDIKREIAAKMEGQTDPSLRIKALIETPETRRALEQMLKQLEPKKETVIDV